MNRNMGMLLLGIYLVIVGLGAFVSLGAIGTITSVLALIAGILIIMGR